MEKFELKGIWRGEYVHDDRFQPKIVKTSVPFVLKIRAVDDNGLFEGMCQDDPTKGSIDFPAEIYGEITHDEIVFTKKYSKTVFIDHYGNLIKSDQPHPDIIYQTKISGNGKIFGTWKVERTFVKINEKVMQLGPVSGVWWMDRLGV
jgi:hypothetical protein